MICEKRGVPGAERSGRMGRMEKTYRYEIHLHTSETSPCGRVPGARCAALHAAAGYDAVCVTDHYFRAIAERLPGRDPASRAHAWLSGFRAVREEGSRLGLTVLPAMELRFDDSWNDYLVYGITEELLACHPALYAMDWTRFRAFADEHGLFVAQAHPYRDGCRPTDPRRLDGIETWNGNPRHDSRNASAEALADLHPHLVRLAGSDFHQECDLAGASMRLPGLAQDSAELVRLLRAGGTADIGPCGGGVSAQA